MITPTNTDALVKFTANLFVKSYPNLMVSMSYDEILNDEYEILKYDFEGNVEAYRKRSKRKVREYNNIKSRKSRK